MKEKTLIGYRVKSRGDYVTHSGPITPTKTKAFTLNEAYYCIGAFLDMYPNEKPPVIVKVFKVRHLTPLEATSSQLGDLLLQLTDRFGVNLGLTKEQVAKRLQQELTDLGAKPEVKV